MNGFYRYDCPVIEGAAALYRRRDDEVRLFAIRKNGQWKLESDEFLWEDKIAENSTLLSREEAAVILFEAD